MTQTLMLGSKSARLKPLSIFRYGRARTEPKFIKKRTEDFAKIPPLYDVYVIR